MPIPRVQNQSHSCSVIIIGEYRTEPVGPPCLPNSIYYHRQNATILQVHRLKFLGTRIPYYGNATATFQLDILVSGDISSNPGPDCSANKDIVDLHTYSRITYKSEEHMKMSQSSSPISTIILNRIKLLGLTPLVARIEEPEVVVVKPRSMTCNP